jgi:hypothetical protein
LAFLTLSQHPATHLRALPRQTAGMSYVPSLYKARRVPLKQPVCGICIDRTRGTTSRVELGYGVVVWLCQAHASAGFLAGRGGRDLVLTLMRTWQAHGCYTARRQKALTAHLNGLRSRPPRARPGSYAWPALRVRVEAACAKGAGAQAVAQLAARARYGIANPPSARTLRRWRTEQRWRSQPPPSRGSP